MPSRFGRLDASTRTFVWGLLAITAIGWAVRLVFILHWRWDVVMVNNDASIYHEAANLLADGKGFVDPMHTIGGTPRQAAFGPPLYLIWLAIPSVLGFTSWHAHLLWTSVLGAAAVAVIGLTGREIGGNRLGLIAAGLAAIAPELWWWNGALFVESMAVLTGSLAILLTYRYRNRPSWRRAAWLGFAVGLAAMSRAELVLLVPFVVLPVILATRSIAPARRWKWFAVAVLTLAIPLAPWVGYNLFRFEHPVTLSTGFEVTFAASNCHDTYYGPFTGYWSLKCVVPVTERELGHGIAPGPVRFDQSEEQVVYRRTGLHYFRHHLDRWPVVVLARLGRITELWNRDQTIILAQYPEGMERWAANGIVWAFYPTVVLAAIGAFVLRHRRVPIYPLLAIPATVLIVTAVTFANLRYRAPAEAPLLLLAAVAIEAAYAWVRRRAAGPRAVGPDGPAEPVSAVPG